MLALAAEYGYWLAVLWLLVGIVVYKYSSLRGVAQELRKSGDWADALTVVIAIVVLWPIQFLVWYWDHKDKHRDPTLFD